MVRPVDPTTWNRAARFYRRQEWLERVPLNAAIDTAGIGAGDRLLDLATGTGALLRVLARRPVSPREAIGIDISAAMLGRAPAFPPGWELQKADATDLPLPDRSFDVITATYLLHLLPRAERAAVIAEAGRVLRPDGRLVVVTVAVRSGGMLARGLSPVFRAAERSHGAMAGLRPLDPRPDLEDAGFAIRDSRYIVLGYPSLVVAAVPAGSRWATTGPRAGSESTRSPRAPGRVLPLKARSTRRP